MIKMLVREKWSIASIFLLFILSFFARIPHLTNDIDTTDVANIQILNTLEIWNQKSAAYFSFLPVQSYQENGDKNIHYYKRFVDEKSNNYYVSYPPLCYILPYALHKLGFDLNRLLIVWLNIFLHFISSLFLLKLLLVYSKTKGFSFDIFSTMSFFILMPVMTFSFTRMYFAETFGLCLWIMSIYYFYKMTFTFPKQKKHFVLFIISLTLLAYTEWTSVFFLISISIFLLLDKSNLKSFRLKLFLGSFSAVMMALCLFAIQLIHLNSIDIGAKALAIRFLERSGWFGSNYSSDGITIFKFSSLVAYFKILAQSFHIAGILMSIFIISIIGINRKKIVKEKNTFYFFTFIVFLPILLHTVVFFNANALHYHLQIKWIFVISLAWFFANQYLKESHLKIVIQGLTVILILFISILNPVFKPMNGNFLNFVAKEIKNETDNNTAIFANIQSQPNTPFNLVYLSFSLKRNIEFAENCNKASQLAEKYNHTQFIFVEANQSRNNIEIMHTCTNKLIHNTDSIE